MDAYHIAYTLIALLLATAWFVRPRKPPLQDDPEAPHVHWRIMATTLNCAEAPSVRTLMGDGDTTALRAWLPRGADVYAVAVQECLCWDDLREKILDHLGAAYIIVGHAAIGSQSLRGHIGLAVFARRCDVDAGTIYALGEKQLPLGAAATATKGGVSLEVKVGARTLRFLGAHLPADAGGLAQRSLRNACAAALLGGEEAVALQERCHVLLLGDLNYRAVPSDLAHARDSTLKRVAAARRRPVPVTWAAATRDDELSEDRRAGRALCGFREAPIYFAPTFRRVPGVALPGKDASADELCAAYTMFKPEAGAATVEEALAMARKTEAPPAPAASAAGLRYPAWTDRVLAASPPADEAALELLAYDAPELFLRSDHRPVRLRCTLARAPPASGYAGAVRVKLDELCFDASSGDDDAEHDLFVASLVGAARAPAREGGIEKIGRAVEEANDAKNTAAKQRDRVSASLGTATASAPWSARAVSVEADRAPRHCVISLGAGAALVALPERDWSRRFREPVVRFGRNRGVLSGRMRVEAYFPDVLQ